MSHNDATNRPPPITDPNKRQVQYIDQATFHGSRSGMLDLTLCTIMPMPDPTANFIYEAVVSARLRFDVGMARALIEGLSKQIAIAESLYSEAEVEGRNARTRLAN